MSLPIILGTSGLDLKEGVAGAGAGFPGVVLYDARGIPIAPNYLAIFSVEIRVRQSAATGAGARVWAIRNPSGSRKVVLVGARVQQFFDGTAAATLMKYDFEKVTGVTAFTGGVAVAPWFDTGLGGPTAEVRLLDTGLTLTGAAIQGISPIAAQGRVTQTTTNFNSSIIYFDFTEGGLFPGYTLETNEALAIKSNVVSVIGDNINGRLYGYER